jgi:hypothetical protein
LSRVRSLYWQHHISSIIIVAPITAYLWPHNGAHRHCRQDITPGEYVLGWRWDCEESTQVWSGCADVTIISP